MDSTVRLLIFFSIFSLISLAEYFLPKRKQILKRVKRWPSNLGLATINILTIRLIFPVSLVGFAAIVTQKKLGLLSFMPLPLWLTILLSLIILDLIIYWQHLIFHKIPILWRIHRVHHSDTEFDVTTALRFHTFEIILSLLIKCMAVFLLGIPPAAVFLFEIILNSSAMFNHSNLNIPQPVDSMLRHLFVTPDMHRIHHSVIPIETNSNYGFNLAIWDKIFNSYRSQPMDGHEKMQIGLTQFRAPENNRLDKMLIQPFC